MLKGAVPRYALIWPSIVATAMSTAATPIFGGPRSAACRPSRRLQRRAFAPKGSPVESHAGLSSHGAMALRSSGSMSVRLCRNESLMPLERSQSWLYRFERPMCRLRAREWAQLPERVPSLTCESARDVVQIYDTATGLRIEHRYSFPFRKKL